jgi:hypothetical protein
VEKALSGLLLFMGFICFIIFLWVLCVTGLFSHHGG